LPEVHGPHLGVGHRILVRLAAALLRSTTVFPTSGAVADEFGGGYAYCFYPLSVFKSKPTSNGEGMDRK
jgi:hypothetical protein